MNKQIIQMETAAKNVSFLNKYVALMFPPYKAVEVSTVPILKDIRSIVAIFDTFRTVKQLEVSEITGIREEHGSYTLYYSLGSVASSKDPEIDTLGSIAAGLFAFRDWRYFNSSKAATPEEVSDTIRRLISSIKDMKGVSSVETGRIRVVRGSLSGAYLLSIDIGSVDAPTA
jgi:hypothetical protein